MTFLGTSSGAVVATILACGIQAEEGFDIARELARDARKRWLGPFGRMSRYLRSGLERRLPADAHLLSKGRLYISVTEFPGFKNRLFKAELATSKQDLMQMILASCYLPLYYERPVRFQGRWYLDGCFTDNCPRLDAATITVSPKSGWSSVGSHISPASEPHWRYAFIPDEALMRELFRKGEEDCARFLESR